MSAQSIQPPPNDKSIRTSRPPEPPPPPSWRNWLWPIMLLSVVVLWFYLPNAQHPINLSYERFITQADTHQIKTATFENSAGRSTTTATGELRNGMAYTTVIPSQPTAALRHELTADGVEVRIIRRSILGFTLLSLSIFLIPLFFMFFLFRLESVIRHGHPSRSPPT